MITGHAVTWELRREVEDLIYKECALLDEWRLDEWLGLFTEDCRYFVPTTDLPAGDPAKDLAMINDNFNYLRGRVERLKSRHAHREYPSSRTRHLVTNLRIEDAGEGQVRVQASFAVFRARDASGRWSQLDVYVGKSEYGLVRQPDGLKIKEKRAILDLEGLHGHGAVSIIL